MKLSAKYIWTIAIFGILAAGIGGWFGYGEKGKENPQSVLDNRSVTQSEDQPSQLNEIDSIQDLVDAEYQFEPVDTSDWQIYRNEEAGFEVKIPGEWFCDGSALELDSKHSVVCLEKKNKEVYFSGKAQINNLLMINFPDLEKISTSSFEENLNISKRTDAKVYVLKIDGRDSVLVSHATNIANVFDESGKWNIVGFPLLQKEMLDGFLLSFKFIK
jgi:hypothetical protein